MLARSSVLRYFGIMHIYITFIPRNKIFTFNEMITSPNIIDTITP